MNYKGNHFNQDNRITNSFAEIHENLKIILKKTQK